MSLDSATGLYAVRPVFGRASSPVPVPSLKPGPLFQLCLETIHARQPAKRKELKEILAAQNPKTLTHDAMLSWVGGMTQYNDGVPPDPRTEGISADTRALWTAKEYALLYGWGELKGGQTIAHFAHEHGFTPARAAVSDELIAVNQLKFFLEGGEKGFPNAHTKDPIDGLKGYSWPALHYQLQLRNSSLRQNRIQYGMELEKLSEDIIVDQALKSHKIYKKTKGDNRYGHLPGAYAGRFPDYPGETYAGANTALRHGQRGLPGGSSLQKLYIKRGFSLPPDGLSEDLIFDLQMKAFARDGVFPTDTSGNIHEYIDDTWSAFETALREGERGLSGGSSLVKLRETRIHAKHAEYRSVHGKKPDDDTVLFPEYPGVTWGKIVASGYPMMRSLQRENGSRIGDLSESIVIHHAFLSLAQNDSLPNQDSDRVDGLAKETWKGWNRTLEQGGRGMTGGSSLHKLYIKHGLRFETIDEDVIFNAAMEHLRLTGDLPTRALGTVFGVPAETWSGLHTSLVRGLRGLPGGESLAQLIHRKLKQQAEKHMEATGLFPEANSGPLPDFPAVDWGMLDASYKKNKRYRKEGVSKAVLGFFEGDPVDTAFAAIWEPS